jgi:Cd2+/Zn2+-exporting ATPase
MADQAEPGSICRIRPGEKLSLDGLIVDGFSTINQAPITGESLAVEKKPGDPVYAGTINESGSFEYKVTSAFEDSTLSKIIKAVEQAQSSRAPTQRFVDAFASVYTPLIFLIAILTSILPPILWSQPFLPWFYKAIVILVIACPCAMVISTPVAIVSGLARASRKGLLIKGGVFLEKGKKLFTIALDKTGTITTGHLVMTDKIDFSQKGSGNFYLWAQSLADRSDHPVSKAICEAESNKDFSFPQQKLLEVSSFSAIAGQGIQGEINGKKLFLASPRFMKLKGFVGTAEDEVFQRLENEGKTVTVLADDKGLLCCFAANDQIRDSSVLALKELKKLGLKTIMLTGDNSFVSARVAKKVGLDDYLSGLLPQEKLEAINSLSNQGPVGMVGDGINDAPALAKAFIGFAMGAAGSDVAIETCDVAIMDDDLGKIPTFIKLSRATGWILWQNIILTLGVKVGFLLLTFFWQTSMLLAILADVGLCLLVVANSLRLLKK